MHWSSFWKLQAVTRCLRSWKQTMSGLWWRKRIPVHMPCCTLLGMHPHTDISILMYMVSLMVNGWVGKYYCMEDRQMKSALRVCNVVCLYTYMYVHVYMYMNPRLLCSRLLSDSYPDEVKKTVDCLSGNLTGVYDAHRITVVSFYSEVGLAFLPVLWLPVYVFVVYQSTTNRM